MIACAPYALSSSATPVSLRRGIPLKQLDSSRIVCTRGPDSFRVYIPSFASFLCECLSSQNGSCTQPTLSSELEMLTTFVEEKLMDALSQIAGDLRQIVLLTDGEDYRQYRLLWPPRTLIFNVLSQFSNPTTKGTNVPKSCVVRYIQADLEESAGFEGWTDRLRKAGYQGNKPSVWILQGKKFAAHRQLQKVLENISGLAMKGSVLIGDIPSDCPGGWLEAKDEAKLKQVEKIFMSCGFRISLSLCKHSCHASHKKHGSDDVHVLIVGEQLRLSDDQVNIVIRETERAEECGDEDAFEDW